MIHAKYQEYAENTNAATAPHAVTMLRLYIIILNSVKRVYAPFAVLVKASLSGGRIKHYEQAKDS